MHYKQTRAYHWEVDGSQDAPNTLPGLPHPTHSQRINSQKTSNKNQTKCTENPQMCT